MSDDFDVVLDALRKRRDDLWKMTQRNMNSEYVGLNIMDDIRLRQIDELDDAIKSITANNDFTDWKAKYDALLTEYEAQANRAITNNDFKERLAQAIEQMPFGDTATSFATFVREFK